MPLSSDFKDEGVAADTIGIGYNKTDGKNVLPSNIFNIKILDLKDENGRPCNFFKKIT